MSWLAPNTFVTFCKGMTLPALSGIFAEAERPPVSTGESSGWAWVTHDAYAAERGQTAWELACGITGYRYADRASDPDRVETVFLASTPACACPHGQNYMVPHCAGHPFQFAYSRGGFERTYFNLGGRRESRRAGGMASGFPHHLSIFRRGCASWGSFWRPSGWRCARSPPTTRIIWSASTATPR